MILIIDNYDSFVYNLARYIEELGYQVLVVRNDQITIAAIIMYQPTHIVISPGPCGPDDAGISLAIVNTFAGKIPILGVCLGHQVIGRAFGSQVIKAKKPLHGKASVIVHDEQGMFTNIPSPLTIGRYHSLIVCEQHLNPELQVTSRSIEGEVMSLSSKKWRLVGMQFHPESVLTDYGHQLLANFLHGFI